MDLTGYLPLLVRCTEIHIHSMGNKQEEPEAIVQQENYNVIAIIETRCDDSHNWSGALNSYKLFKRDRLGRRGGGVALCLKECFDCLELDDDEKKNPVLSSNKKQDKRKQPQG